MLLFVPSAMCARAQKAAAGTGTSCGAVATLLAPGFWCHKGISCAWLVTQGQPPDGRRSGTQGGRGGRGLQTCVSGITPRVPHSTPWDGFPILCFQVSSTLPYWSRRVAVVWWRADAAAGLCCDVRVSSPGSKGCWVAGGGICVVCHGWLCPCSLAHVFAWRATVCFHK